jgi:oligosaccharide repeat unit polymerase
MYSNDDILLPCVNALLYLGILFFAIKRKHSIFILISTVWVICALLGIIYSLIPFTLTSHDLSLEPYIYLFTIFLIGLYPMSKLKLLDRNSLIVIYNSRIVNSIILLLAICSFIPVVESTLHILSSGLGNLASNYEDRLDDFDTRGYFTIVGRIFYSVEEYFEFLTPTFLFVYITSYDEKRTWIIVGMCLAVISPLLNNLANGQRYYVVVFLYMMLFNFLLFRNLFDEKLKKNIFKWAISVGSIVGVVFVAISLNRTGNGTEELGAGYQVIRYMGESMYNFNTDCFWITDYVFGEHSFKGLFSYFHINQLSISDQTSLLGIVSNAFYTYVGAFVMDFGLIPTFVILSLFSLICWRMVISVDNEINLGLLILISLYSNILLFGTTYFVYENGFIHLVWSIVLAIYLLNTKTDNNVSVEDV